MDSCAHASVPCKVPGATPPVASEHNGHHAAASTGPSGGAGRGRHGPLAGSVSISLTRRGGQVPKDRQAAGPRPLLVLVAGWGLLPLRGQGPRMSAALTWARGLAVRRPGRAWAGGVRPGRSRGTRRRSHGHPADASGSAVAQTASGLKIRSGGRRAPGRRWIGARSRTARHVASSVALSEGAEPGRA